MADYDLVSPAVSENDLEATFFLTVNASAPNIAGLKHNIPPVVGSGTFHTVNIWGAISTDGGAVTYDLSDITGGLSFSKTTGITENEPITMTAPTISTAVAYATLNITAVSEYGPRSAKVPVNVMILKETEWIYTEDGTFTPPVNGIYEVKCGAGGGGSTAISSYASMPAGNGYCAPGGAGGGGGCAIKELELTTQSYPVTVGKGGIGSTWGGINGQDGGVSSFSNLLSATGGKGGIANSSGNIVNTPGGDGGVGVGGDRNTTGGKGGGKSGGNYPFNQFTYYVRAPSGGGGAGDSNGGNGVHPEDDGIGVTFPNRNTVPTQTAGGL